MSSFGAFPAPVLLARAAATLAPRWLTRWTGPASGHRDIARVVDRERAVLAAVGDALSSAAGAPRHLQAAPAAVPLVAQSIERNQRPRPAGARTTRLRSG